MSASATLGLQLASTGAMLATKAFDHRKADKQADLKLDQQRRQANHDLMVSLSPHAVDLVAECVKASNSFLQFRQESLRTQLEHEAMQRQADIAHDDLTSRHTHAMNQLKQSGENFLQTVQVNQQALQDIKERLAALDSHTAALISAMTQPGSTTADRAFYAEALKDLHAQKTQLIEAHRNINNHSHSAYIHSCDTSRDTPRTYTDVGYSS